jgi:signal transduction histidine kinase
MGPVNFRFSTDILRRLGEELNQKPDQGILELVKNSYDADAVNCIVELMGTQEKGGTVCVTDDGDGMTRANITDGWLVLGRSSKSAQNLTRLQRRPAGNKGLGRLAALRMGRIASLITRPRSEPDYEYNLEIDWKLFDEVNVVDEVSLDVLQSPRSSGHGQGTVITIKSLALPWKRADVKNLARGLILLADPFGDNTLGFQPILRAPEFKELERLVQQRYLSDAEFHMVANVSENGEATASVSDWKGNNLYTATMADLRPKSPQQPYCCPKATFDLWIFILDQKTFSARSNALRDVREWLKEFGGVHLYIHGLRVSPYGDAGNDWLDMNLRRVRNPEVRPGTNTSIGRIALADPEGLLLPKTDRSGIVEGEAFQELREFANDALEWLSRRRLDERDQRLAAERKETPQRVEKAQEDVIAAISVLDIPDNARTHLRSTFNKYVQESQREGQALRREAQLSRTLSTAGITQAVFAHEAKHPVEIIQRSGRLIQDRAQKSVPTTYENLLKEPIARIIRQADALRTFGNVTLSLVDHEKRRTSRVSIHNVIGNVKTMFTPLLIDRKVDFTLEFVEGDYFVRGSEAALEAVVTNLLVNSLKAFESWEGERHIAIQTDISGSELTIRLLDNGPGIEGISTNDIWLPGETTYDNGTGLGLSIVRDTVRDLGGRVEAVPHGDMGGAEFRIYLPVLEV